MTTRNGQLVLICIKVEIEERNMSRLRPGAVRVGHPLAAYTYGYIRPKVDYTKLNLGADGDEELYPVETANGETRSLEAMLIYDKRDDRFAPTKGIFTRATVEYAGLGGDKFYTKET